MNKPIIQISKVLWDHVPSIEEIKASANPAQDPVQRDTAYIEDIGLYLRFTGLRIFTNGSGRYRTEYKYYIDKCGDVHYPGYKIPAESDFILI